RGAGAAIALPFLDAMHPAFAAERSTAAAPLRRLGIVYFPHGATDRWLPSGEGPSFKLSPGLAPLDRHKSRILVLAGLSAVPDRTKPEFHDRAVASWLTGCELTRGKVQVGISMDQIAAAHFGKQTQFSSLELGTEFQNGKETPFYKDAHTVLPIEINPRVVFERLFGDGGRIDPAAAAERNAVDQSTLDGVIQQIAALKSRLGAADRIKLDQYLSSIRDVERRIQIASAAKPPELPRVDRPAGIPDTWPEHVKMMFDLQVLAFQADLTRVCSFMMAKESSLITFPHLGISMQHHEASHHNYEQDKLDDSIIFFGSTLSNPTVHSQRNLPVVLAGGAAGRLNTGRLVQYSGDLTPLSNMHLTILDKLDIPTDKMGDSTGPLKLDRLSV